MSHFCLTTTICLNGRLALCRAALICGYGRMSRRSGRMALLLSLIRMCRRQVVRSEANSRRGGSTAQG